VRDARELFVGDDIPGLGIRQVHPRCSDAQPVHGRGRLEGNG
jgi:hypothetical protein